jgi:hypothetical protein
VGKHRLVEGLATLGSSDTLTGFAHGTKGRHYAIPESMTRTRNTSISALLNSGVKMAGLRDKNLFVKVAMCSRKVWVAGFLDRKMMEG